MPRIFISYKRVDKEHVFKIKDQIESGLGERCWIDLDGIESDAQFKNVIIRAIRDCDVFLFMYSKTHSTIENFEKDWTMRELNFAEKKGKRIIFINIDGTPLIDEFEFDFGTKQQIDARSDDALIRLKKDLKKWLRISENGLAAANTDALEKEIDDAYEAEDIVTLSKFAAQGNAKAQFYLGCCYDEGDGVSQSYEKAVEWYRKAAEQGYADAQVKLGTCYYLGKGVPQSYEKAVEWYRKAAEQGDASAQYELGTCYYLGKGVPPSYEKVVEWYRKAAEQGHAKAQCNFGVCYARGKGVPQSYEKAVEWYRKAAEQGDMVAQNNLGCCYEDGKGVPQSYEKAVEWYRKAAEQGNKDANNRLEKLTKNVSSESSKQDTDVDDFVERLFRGNSITSLLKSII